jgi:CubicO group peptidase (beta-lactamase class C family)
VLGPAGTVHCSLEDWLKFARLHLGEEVGELQLDEATLAKLHSDPDGDGYALGWGVTEREWGGGTVLTHAGSNTMWFAVIWLAPERGAAYVAATNSAVESAPRACDEAIAMMIELSGK